MSVLDKMEQRMKWLRKPQLILFMLGAYVVGFILNYILPSLMYYFYFNPALIFQGQVWRIITFLLVPNTDSFFLALITCFIYFSITRSLEQVIGRFRVNFFLILGVILQIVFGFIYYFVFASNVQLMMYAQYVMILNPYYLYAMLFVLFALLFPDARFLFMFIIPIRGKFLVFVTMGLYVLDVVQAFANGNAAYGWMLVAMIVAAVLTIVIFWLMSDAPAKKSRRQREYDNVVNMRSASRNANAKREARHKCAICGRTELTDPNLEFRYCSKCIGNYEYCTEHLYTHIHRGTGDQI